MPPRDAEGVPAGGREFEPKDKVAQTGVELLSYSVFYHFKAIRRADQSGKGQTRERTGLGRRSPFENGTQQCPT